ncbi:MAG: ABC transporter ATP-binding protein [Oscillospiraceae bacterium]|nr:ABC transporter ATP-binding protein [Oscillospiraceae bacterium]
MGKKWIEVEHLTKIYGKGETALKALDAVSFTVQTGEFAAVTGESGSGKTTLLNILGSLDRADEGTVRVDEMDLMHMDDNALAAYRRQKIGIIFQSFNLIPVLNVEENIVLPLNLDNVEVDRAFLDEMLTLTGLTEKRLSFPHELSGGQQQRVAFVRALIHKPDVILADEPTGNLDTRNSREIIHILKESIRKYNQTLLLITHDPAIAAQADRIFRMTDGRLTEEGLPK